MQGDGKKVETGGCVNRLQLYIEISQKKKQTKFGGDGTKKINAKMKISPIVDLLQEAKGENHRANGLEDRPGTRK